jgi:hypothetical protein
MRGVRAARLGALAATITVQPMAQVEIVSECNLKLEVLGKLGAGPVK